MTKAIFALFLLLNSSFVASDYVGQLSPNITITSSHLGYDVQYRVFIPKHYSELDDLPTIYVTDGQDYIKSGEMPRLMKRLVGQNRMRPAIAVFIDSRDTANLSHNRRNSQFVCNYQYFEFVTTELVNKIYSDYRTSPNAEDRVILGLSLGGLNSACFGLLASDTFTGIAMQSPYTLPVPDLIGYYEKSERLPLNFFISTGARNDGRRQTRVLQKALEKKGYPIKYREVGGSHDWYNWRPLLDDILVYYFPQEKLIDGP
jgi:enterochelin esterase-like enzyme